MKIEVLVSTMHQTDHSLPVRMNLQTDAVIINQCDRNEYELTEHNGHRVLWINTVQRGLSKSRNMALSYAEGDICLLADDDIVYPDGYEQMVAQAFREQCKADIIAFNTHMVNAEHMSGRKEIKENGKAPRHSYYGSVRMAFRLERVRKNGLHFNEVFGAGARYAAGEESLFLRECRKKGLRVYRNKAYLCIVDYSSSTWFEGINEKYYFNRGVFLAAAYGRMAWLFKLYYLMQSRRISGLGLSVVNRNIKAGMKEFQSV